MENKPEKTEGRIDFSGNRFLRWLDNYWYHYKWITLICLFFAIVITVSLVQCSTEDRADITPVYCGGYSLSATEVRNINGVFRAVMNPGDADALIAAELTHYTVYTPEELLAMHTDEDGKRLSTYESAKQQNAVNYSNFKDFFSTWSCQLWFVSEYVYEELGKGMDRETYLLPLSEIFEEIPASAADAYAVRLKDTDLYARYDVLHVFPEDTLVLMSRPSEVFRNEKNYQSYLSLFRTVIDCGNP